MITIRLCSNQLIFSRFAVKLITKVIWHFSDKLNFFYVACDKEKGKYCRLEAFLVSALELQWTEKHLFKNNIRFLASQKVITFSNFILYATAVPTCCLHNHLKLKSKITKPTELRATLNSRLIIKSISYKAFGLRNTTATWGITARKP